MLTVPGEKTPGTVQAIVQDSAAASLEEEQPACEIVREEDAKIT